MSQDGFHIRAGGPRSAMTSHGPHASLRIEAGDCVLNVHITDGEIHIHGKDAIAIEPSASNAIVIKSRGEQ